MHPACMVVETLDLTAEPLLGREEPRHGDRKTRVKTGLRYFGDLTCEHLSLRAAA